MPALAEKENEQLLDDKESYGKVNILVQLTILVYTKKNGKKIAINNVPTTTVEIQRDRTQMCLEKKYLRQLSPNQIG